MLAYPHLNSNCLKSNYPQSSIEVFNISNPPTQPPSQPCSSQRPLSPHCSSHIEIKRLDQYKIWIIFHRLLSLLREVIPIDQIRQQNLNLRQCQIEPDTAPRPRCKRQISPLSPLFHLLCIPSIGIESLGIRPERRVRVDGVQCGD